MLVWKVVVVDSPGKWDTPKTFYVTAYTEHEAKEELYRHVTGKEYTIEQRSIAFLKIKRYAEF